MITLTRLMAGVDNATLLPAVNFVIVSAPPSVNGFSSRRQTRCNWEIHLRSWAMPPPPLVEWQRP